MQALPSLIPSDLTRYAYRAHQAAIRLPLLAAHLGLRPFASRRATKPEPQDLKALQTQLEALLVRDCQNAEFGLYPARQLFDIPVREYLRQLPSLATEVLRSMRRSKQKLVRDLPPDLDLSVYPDYFRRNFHWQTDGYLSARSAALYDVGVEFLFLGTADVMRRQIVPPVTHFLRARGKRAGARAYSRCGLWYGQRVEPNGAGSSCRKVLGARSEPVLSTPRCAPARARE